MEFFRTRIWRKKSYLSTQYHQITPLYQHANFSHRQVRRYPIFSLMVSKIELYLHRLNVKSIHEEMNVLCLSQCFIVMWTFKLNCWYEAWFTKRNRNLIWLFFISTTVILLYCLTSVDGLIRYEWLSSVLYRASSIWLVMVFIVACNTIVF